MSGAKGMAWTLGLVFVVAFLVQIVASGPLNLWETDVAVWQQAVNAGVMAVIAFLINYLSPWIDRYGVGAK